MDSKKEKKRDPEENDKRGTLDTTEERQQQQGQSETERPVLATEERGRIALGLRLAGKRLHFLFRGRGGVVEHWGFRGTQLADNQWHTLVLAVAGGRVRLTVDCRSPLEM